MNYSIVYACIGLYLSIGLVLLLVKSSPVSKQVAKDVQEIEIRYYTRQLTTGEKPSYVKIKLYHFIISILLLFLYPLIIFGSFLKEKVTETAPEQRQYKFPPPPSFDSDPSLFTEQVSVTEAEKAHMVTINGRQIPFGYNNAQWQRLLSKMQDGNKLWEFTTDDESWPMQIGREGLSLARNGKIVFEIITAMS